MKPGAFEPWVRWIQRVHSPAVGAVVGVDVVALAAAAPALGRLPALRAVVDVGGGCRAAHSERKSRLRKEEAHFLIGSTAAPPRDGRASRLLVTKASPITARLSLSALCACRCVLLCSFAKGFPRKNNNIGFFGKNQNLCVTLFLVVRFFGSCARTHNSAGDTQSQRNRAW